MSLRQREERMPLLVSELGAECGLQIAFLVCAALGDRCQKEELTRTWAQLVRALCPPNVPLIKFIIRSLSAFLPNFPSNRYV